MADDPPVVNRPAGTDVPSIDTSLVASASDGANDVGAEGVGGPTLPSTRGQAIGAGYSRGSRYIYRDLTTGSVPKNLAHLAWPQVLEGIFHIAEQMVDLVWAGRLPGGFRAIAGVGVGMSFSQFGMMGRQGLDQCLRAMVARAVGAKNIPRANHIALQGFTLTGIYCLLMMLVGLFLTDVLLRLIGASQAVHAETAMYMRIQFIGMATNGFRQASGAALQASGEVMTPFKATTVTRVFHVLLSPFLIFGWWWFPSFGLPGAAIANVLGQILGCAINFYALFHGTSRLHLTLEGYRVDYSLLGQMIKISAPASVAGMERATAQLIFLRFVSPFGDVALAAYALTRRVELFLNFGSQGIGQASGIMVGQNLGAGQPDRAKQSIFWGLAYVQIIPLIVRVVMFVSPVILIAIFTTQSDVVALASTWLRLQVIAAFFMGMAMVFQQSFYGAGDTLAPMIVTLMAVWLIEVPLAWILSHTIGLGPLGIGYANIVGMASRLALYVPYYFWGRWLKIQLI